MGAPFVGAPFFLYRGLCGETLAKHRPAGSRETPVKDDVVSFRDDELMFVSVGCRACCGLKLL